MFRRLQHLLTERRSATPPPEPASPPSAGMEALLAAIQKLSLLHHVDLLARIAVPPEHTFAADERFTFPLTPIADAVVHTLILSVADDRFYLLRQGGFAGVNEWYEGAFQQTLEVAGVMPTARG